MQILIAGLLLVGPDVETVKIPETTLTFDLVRIECAKLGGRALKPFSIGKREVTWELMDHFAESKDLADVDTVTRPSKAKSYFGQVGYPPAFGKAERPATNLRWHSAIAYCEWLSRKTGAWYRLPTEAEWEAACRAGAKGEGPAKLDDVAWHKGNSKESTHVGAGKKPNGFGIYDMLGNVWEYCLEPAKPPHFGPVLRGGAWNRPASDLTFAKRQIVPRAWFEPDPNRPRSTWWLQADFTQGMRVVRVAGATDSKDRAAYAAKMEVKAKSGEEWFTKIEGAPVFFNQVKGTVKNTGDRVLDEVEVMVWSLKENGKPHLLEIVGADKPGRATWGKVYPALANSAHEGGARKPFKPGESRAWVVDLPYSFDEPPDLEPEKWGARVTNLRFAP